MFQDPNQRQGSNSGYSNVPQSSNPNGTPPSQTSLPPLQQDPYGVPAQNPYGAGYGQPAHPSQPAYDGSAPGYGSPSNYGTPPNYGTQPNYQQQNYGTPYGAPNYGQTGYGTPVASAPLPLGEAVRQLPNQYIKVLTKPSTLTFDQEKGKAAWDIVWVQLMIFAVAFAVLSFLGNLIFPAATGQPGGTGSAASILANLGGASLLFIIIIPLAFFIEEGILYLIAKAFRGEGTFLQQGYTALLFSTPIAIIDGILLFIPILGSLAILALGVYAVVLNIFSIMSVHRLNGGKATAVVLIPGAVATLLFCGLFALIVAIIAASIPH